MLAGRIGETLNDTPRHREINYLLARKVLEAMPLISYPQISCLAYILFTTGKCELENILISSTSSLD